MSPPELSTEFRTLISRRLRAMDLRLRVKISRLNAKRLFAWILLTCHMSTHVLFAHSPEKSFWESRRRALTKPEDLLSGLPTPMIPEVSPNISLMRSAQAGGAGLPQRDRALLTQLPLDRVSLRKVRAPSGPSQGLVLFLQDVHGNPDAQESIGAAVSSVLDTVGVVGLEGAFGRLDLDYLRSFPDNAAARNAARELRLGNIITGPIETLLTTTGAIPKVMGVDDPSLHAANVEAYQRAARMLAPEKERLRQARVRLEAVKNKDFNSDLLDFDRMAQSYGNGSSSLVPYARRLARGGGAVGRTLLSFLEVVRREETLDFKRAERERGRFLDLLVARSSQAERETLLSQSLSFQAGRVTPGEFYGWLETHCGAMGVSMSSFPALREYVRYTLDAQSIDVDELFADMRNRESSLYGTLARSSMERRLVSESRRLSLVEKLVDFSLTPAEWREYEKSAFTKDPAGPNGSRSESTLSTVRSDAENFYRTALARDGAMADNLLAALSETDTQYAVIVAGGYHTGGLTDRLVRAGYTVAEIVPKIDKMDTPQGAAYLSIFTREKSPLDTLFEGSKLFLAENPLSSRSAGEFALAASALSTDNGNLTPPLEEFLGKKFNHIGSDKAGTVTSITATPIGQTTPTTLSVDTSKPEGQRISIQVIDFPSGWQSRLRDALEHSNPKEVARELWYFWRLSLFPSIILGLGLACGAPPVVIFSTQLIVGLACARVEWHGFKEAHVTNALPRWLRDNPGHTEKYYFTQLSKRYREIVWFSLAIGALAGSAALSADPGISVYPLVAFFSQWGGALFLGLFVFHLHENFFGRLLLGRRFVPAMAFSWKNASSLGIRIDDPHKTWEIARDFLRGDRNNRRFTWLKELISKARGITPLERRSHFVAYSLYYAFGYYVSHRANAYRDISILAESIEALFCREPDKLSLETGLVLLARSFQIFERNRGGSSPDRIRAFYSNPLDPVSLAFLRGSSQVHRSDSPAATSVVISEINAIPGVNANHLLAKIEEVPSKDYYSPRDFPVGNLMPDGHYFPPSLKFPAREYCEPIAAALSVSANSHLLTSALHSKSHLTRYWAAYALIQIGSKNPSVTNELLVCMSDSLRDSRHHAMSDEISLLILPFLGTQDLNRSQQNKFAAAISSAKPLHTWNAINRLFGDGTLRIPLKYILPHLSKGSWTYDNAIFAHGSRSVMIVPVLLRLLASKDVPLSSFAQRTLVRLSNFEGVPDQIVDVFPNLDPMARKRWVSLVFQIRWKAAAALPHLVEMFRGANESEFKPLAITIAAVAARGNALNKRKAISALSFRRNDFPSTNDVIDEAIRIVHSGLPANDESRRPTYSLDNLVSAVVDAFDNRLGRLPIHLEINGVDEILPIQTIEDVKINQVTVHIARRLWDIAGLISSAYIIPATRWTPLTIVINTTPPTRGHRATIPALAVAAGSISSALGYTRGDGVKHYYKWAWLYEGVVGASLMIAVWIQGIVPLIPGAASPFVGAVLLAALFGLSHLLPGQKAVDALNTRMKAGIQEVLVTSLLYGIVIFVLLSGLQSDPNFLVNFSNLDARNQPLIYLSILSALGVHSSIARGRWDSRFLGQGFIAEIKNRWPWIVVLVTLFFVDTAFGHIMAGGAVSLAIALATPIPDRTPPVVVFDQDITDDNAFAESPETELTSWLSKGDDTRKVVLRPVARLGSDAATFLEALGFTAQMDGLPDLNENLLNPVNVRSVTWLTRNPLSPGSKEQVTIEFNNNVLIQGKHLDHLTLTFPENIHYGSFSKNIQTLMRYESLVVKEKSAGLQALGQSARNHGLQPDYPVTFILTNKGRLDLKGMGIDLTSCLSEEEYAELLRTRNTEVLDNNPPDENRRSGPLIDEDIEAKTPPTFPKVTDLIVIPSKEAKSITALLRWDGPSRGQEIEPLKKIFDRVNYLLTPRRGSAQHLIGKGQDGILAVSLENLTEVLSQLHLAQLRIASLQHDSRSLLLRKVTVLRQVLTMALSRYCSMLSEVPPFFHPLNRESLPFHQTFQIVVDRNKSMARGSSGEVLLQYVTEDGRTEAYPIPFGEKLLSEEMVENIRMLKGFSGFDRPLWHAYEALNLVIIQGQVVIQQGRFFYITNRSFAKHHEEDSPASSPADSLSDAPMNRWIDRLADEGRVDLVAVIERLRVLLTAGLMPWAETAVAFLLPTLGGGMETLLFAYAAFLGLHFFQDSRNGSLEEAFTQLNRRAVRSFVLFFIPFAYLQVTGGFLFSAWLGDLFSAMGIDSPLAQTFVFVSLLHEGRNAAREISVRSRARRDAAKFASLLKETLPVPQTLGVGELGSFKNDPAPIVKRLAEPLYRRTFARAVAGGLTQSPSSIKLFQGLRSGSVDIQATPVEIVVFSDKDIATARSVYDSLDALNQVALRNGQPPLTVIFAGATEYAQEKMSQWPPQRYAFRARRPVTRDNNVMDVLELDGIWGTFRMTFPDTKFQVSLSVSKDIVLPKEIVSLNLSQELKIALTNWIPTATPVSLNHIYHTIRLILQNA